MTKEHKINASGKKLGRLASEVAHVLLGKDSTDFAKNTVADVKVHVENAAVMDIGEKKLTEKEYQRYSGYPGGRKVKFMKDVIAHNGIAYVVEKAVYNMLPGNKLRKPRMKNLIINE